MTTRSITIGPEKFTIFDSDISDSESEADEWVSVSTSTTISTTSTLPSHLNLNPRSAVKVRPPPPNSGVCQTHNSRASSSPASSPPAPSPPPPPPSLPPTTTLASTPPAVAKESPSPPSQSSKPTPSTHPPTPRDPPTTLLKRFLPTLTAIYIVSPTSISTRPIYERPNPNIYTPLSTLTNFGYNPPISTKATRPNDDSVETYIRVCADCAKPPMTMSCDGTWYSSALSYPSNSRQYCPTHLRAFQLANSIDSTNSPNSVAVQPPAKSNPLTCGKCTQMATIINCADCARKRDETLFQAVLDAVSPFNRAETEMLGVGVFDMSVPVSGEVYRHVEGCGCVR